MSVKADAMKLVQALAEFGESPDDPRRGRHNLTGHGVAEALARLGAEMDPDRINDAVKVLEANGIVKVDRYLGTSPFLFGGVEPHSSGSDRYETAKESQQTPPAVQPGSTGTRSRIFLGHGQSPVWRDLKDFIQDRLELPWDEFNREATAGLSTKERLQKMLDDAMFAFLIMTGEDERSNGAKAARANVIHEAGLFQGRLGFERAIILLEAGCEEFSNIVGLTQIRFPVGNINAVSEEIRRVLEREGIAK